jgi:hypothetical protein
MFGCIAILSLSLSALAQSNQLPAGVLPRILATSPSEPAQLPYTNNFESATAGKVPEDFMVLSGDFTVKADGGNKFLELPGSPLDSFSTQFGPGGQTEAMVGARINGTGKRRRFPTFGIGLNGVAGYRLQVSPSRNLLELYRDQELKGSAPFDWKSGMWTSLRLQVRKDSAGGWKIEGKAWREAATEQAWMISVNDKEDPPAGRASLFGSPFSGTPILYDDLTISKPVP